MEDARRTFGTSGEAIAAEHLSAKGFTILARQVRTPYGEIDLLCEDGADVVFVEVKTRRTEAYGWPEAAITPAKFASMGRSAISELERLGWTERPWRLDVVAIEWPPQTAPTVTHFPAIDGPAGNW